MRTPRKRGAGKNSYRPGSVIVVTARYKDEVDGENPRMAVYDATFFTATGAVEHMARGIGNEMREVYDATFTAENPITMTTVYGRYEFDAKIIKPIVW